MSPRPKNKQLRDSAERNDELERLQRAVVGAIEALNTGNAERAGRILRRCFWGTDKPQNSAEQADREYFNANPE